MAEEPDGLGATPQLSRQEFARIVRQKYQTPEGRDPYADLHDDDLVDVYTAKHPIYQSWITKRPRLPSGPAPFKPGPIPSPDTLQPPPTRVASAKTGGKASALPLGASIFDRPLEGAAQATGGVQRLVTGQGGRLNAASDILEGTMEAAEPLTLTAAASPEAALMLARGLGAGVVGGEVTRRAMEWAGFSPEATRLGANVGSIGAGVVGAEAPSLRRAIGERPRPIAGALEGPPEAPGAARPQVSDLPTFEAAQQTARRTMEAKDFAEGWQRAQAGESAAQQAVSVRQQAEFHAFQQRIEAGMDPAEAVALERQGLLQPPPGLRRLPEAPADVRAIIAHPPGEVVEPPSVDPNRMDITDPERFAAMQGGPRRVIGEAPPVPLEDQFTRQLEDTLSQPPRADVRLTKQPFNLQREGPPTLEQTQPSLRLGPPPRRMKGRVKGRQAGEPSISRQPGGAITPRRQSRLADLAEHEPLPPHAIDDPAFMEATSRAIAEGYTGSPAELYRRYQDQLDKADVMNELNQQTSPRAFLQEIARRGGIKHFAEPLYGKPDPAAGELQSLWEARDLATRTARPGTSAQARGLSIGRPHGGTVGGVARVLRKGGRSLDDLAENSLRLDEVRGPSGQRIESADDLVAAIHEARRMIASGDFGTVTPDLGEGWWRRPAHADQATSFAEAQHRAAEHGGGDLEHAYQDYLKLFGPGDEGGPPLLDFEGRLTPEASAAEARRVREAGTALPAGVQQALRDQGVSEAEIGRLTHEQARARLAGAPPPPPGKRLDEEATFERIRQKRIAGEPIGSPEARAAAEARGRTDAAKEAARRAVDVEAGGPPARPSARASQAGKPGARYIGTMEGFEGQPALKLYNIEDGGPSHGMTVSAETLREKGYAVPDETQPVLPGTEGVREQEIPTPPVADLPFALEAPPAKPGKAQPKPEPSLFDRIRGESGVLVLDVPPGDPIGLKRWLGQHEEAYGDDPWFQRVQQALEDGNVERAWRLSAAASARSIAAAPAQAVRDLRKGTEFARMTGRQAGVGPRGGSVALGAGTDVVAPPPLRRGQPGKGVTAGPSTGGLLRPPPVRAPLSDTKLAALATDMTLGKTYQASLLQATDPSLITLIEGNQDSSYRLFRQVADQSIQGINTKEAKQYLQLSDLEIASHYQRAITAAAQNLAQLSKWRAEHYDSLKFLRPTRSGELKFAGPGGQFASEPPDWLSEPIHIGRGRTITPGVTPDDQTLAALSQEGLSLEKLQAVWAITKPNPQKVGKFEAVENLSRAFLVSKPVTAIRNLWTQVGRYGVGMVDDALAGVFETVAGDPEAARSSFRQAGMLAKGLTRKGTMAVRPWAESMQAVYDYTADRLADLPPSDARKTLAVLEAYPRRAADFMGYAAGELEPGGTGPGQKTTGSKFLDDLTLDPKVRNYLTVFNRAQEHTIRATVFDAVFRSELMDKGFDADHLLAQPHADLVKAVGPEALDELIGTAVYRALDETFASVPLTDSIVGRLLQTFSRHPLLLRFNYPFPRFNLLAAPRFLYDHSPAALADLIAFPFERGRLFRGVQAEGIRTQHLPEIQTKLAGKELELGGALKTLVAAKREAVVRKRLLARAQAQQEALPELGRVEAAQDAFDQATEAVRDASDQVATVKDALKDLRAQHDVLQKKVREAGQIGAPSQKQYLARMATGTLGLFGAALTMRASPGAENTEWYEYRWKGDAGQDSLVDLRSFAPFVQYLFPADVMLDLYRHTDWDGVRAELPQGPAALNPTNYLPTYQAVWDHYSGKYTSEKLATEFAQAFFSMSRAAGTTLTITDLITKQGWPGPSEIAQALVGSIGQFMARFTVPLSTAKELVGEFDPEEAKARIAPDVSKEQPYGPLAAPLANVPFASRLIPETTSQTSGEPLRSANPFGRELSGITERTRTDIEAEFKRIGMPSQAIYIPRTNDQGLDDTLARTYAKDLQEMLPGILSSKDYRDIPTPADQRDFLSKVTSAIRRAAVAEVKQSLGVVAVGRAQEGPAARQKRLRREQLLKRLEAQGPLVIEAEPPEPQGPPGPPQ